MTSVSRKAIAAVLAGSALILTAAGCSSDTAEAEPAPESTFVSKSVLEAGQANPMIAQGVAIGGGAAVYKTSGLGPAASNKAAPEGTPVVHRQPVRRGMLPAGVTVTEAQGINVLKKIRENWRHRDSRSRTS